MATAVTHCAGLCSREPALTVHPPEVEEVGLAISGAAKRCVCPSSARSVALMWFASAMRGNSHADRGLRYGRSIDGLVPVFSGQ